MENIDWDKTDLEFWLQVDSLATDQAIDVLSGFNPDGHTLPYADTGIEYPDTEISRLFIFPLLNFDIKDNDRNSAQWHEFIEAWKFRESLERLWNYSDYRMEDIQSVEAIGLPPFRPLKFYIDYFESKNLRPQWLYWAKENNYLLSNEKEQLNDDEHNLKDEYTAEIETAMKVTTYCRKNFDNKSTPKEYIENYLKEDQFSHLTKYAKKRIAIAANWKKGGPRKTPEK